MFSVEEDGREIDTGASLSGAARIWSDRPKTRLVYQVAPTGPGGSLEKLGEVTAHDLTEARARYALAALQLIVANAQTKALQEPEV